MHIHPIIVHFPIALFITALGLEILSLIFKKEVLERCAFYNYLLGIFGAIAAASVEWIANLPLAHPVFYTHRNFAHVTIIFSLASGAFLLMLKKRSARIFPIIFLLILLVTAILISVTGYYGGRLVYEYGVGVAE